MKFFKKNNEEKKETTMENTLSSSLSSNLDRIKEDFHFETNEDFYIRKVYVKTIDDYGFIVNLGGMIDTKAVEDNIIKPLMDKDLDKKGKDVLNDIEDKILTSSDIKKLSTFREIQIAIINGKTILFIDKSKYVLAIDTIGFKHRNVEKPQNEAVIKGPQEAFVESANTNRSLIRKLIKSKDLITENIGIGETELSNVSIMYIDGIANPDIVNKIKGRIKEIKTDGIDDSSILEQHIEERPYSLIPSLLYTERPDRAAAFLKEGFVVILTEQSPSCLIAPVTFWSYFHSPSDSYDRWIFGNFIRLLRICLHPVKI